VRCMSVMILFRLSSRIHAAPVGPDGYGMR